MSTLSTLSARTWTDVDGRLLEAEYVSQDDKTVTLKLANGKEVKVPFSRLSATDIAHLVELETAEAAKNKPAAGEAGENEDGEVGAAATPKPEANADWDKPVPREATLAAPFEVVEEKHGNLIHYSSPHFRIVADARWKSKPLQEILEACELTYNYCDALPLGLKSRYSPPGGKFEIHTTEKAEDWIKAGGAERGSATFDRNSGQINMCLENYALGSGGRGSGERVRNVVGALVRNVTYAMMPQIYDQSFGDWFKLGLPGVVDSAVYEKSRFDYTEVVKETKELLLGPSRSGQKSVFKKKIQMFPLSDLLDKEVGGVADDEERSRFEGQSILVMTYLIYLQDGGKATNIRSGLRYAFDFEKNFPTSIPARSQEEFEQKKAALIQEARELGAKSTAMMFGERPWPEVEAEITKFWAEHGLELSFEKEEKK